MKKEVKLVLVNVKTKDLINGMICRNIDTNEICVVNDSTIQEDTLNNIVEPYLISNEGLSIGDDVLIHSDDKTGTIYLEKIIATPKQIGYFIDYVDYDTDCGYNLYREITNISYNEINKIVNNSGKCNLLIDNINVSNETPKLLNDKVIVELRGY
jgi:hypothetical protein